MNIPANSSAAVIPARCPVVKWRVVCDFTVFCNCISERDVGKPVAPDFGDPFDASVRSPGVRSPGVSWAGVHWPGVSWPGANWPDARCLPGAQPAFVRWSWSETSDAFAGIASRRCYASSVLAACGTVLASVDNDNTIS